MTEDSIEFMILTLRKIETITFSKHFNEKAIIRGLNKDSLTGMLKNPEQITAVEYQGYENGGHKYGIPFNIMSNYDLRVIFSISGKGLNVITAHIQNVKKRKRFVEWRKG